MFRQSLCHFIVTVRVSRVRVSVRITVRVGTLIWEHRYG